MTKEELEKEAEEYLENNYCKNVCTSAENKHCKSGLQVRCCSFNEKKKFILSFAEPREKRIADLERKLEQTEKDLTDYQFNYPKIKELEKENAELKAVERMALYSKMSDQLTKAKEIIKELLDTQSQLDPYRDIFKDRILKAEQFLSEVEK